MSYPLSPWPYLQIVQTLPQPSAAQCERFIQHIASARRWFKLLPIDGGVSFTLFLNPQAGTPVRSQVLAGGTGQMQRGGRLDVERDTASYREAFGYLDYVSPVARGVGALIGADLGLPEQDTPYVLDAEGRAAPLPAELVAAASCRINALVQLDMATLLDTLPLRVPAYALVPEAGERLAAIGSDGELRTFAENYVREELAGFQCPADREAWEVRQLEGFQQLYTPRNAAQIAQLRHALDALLAWCVHA